MQWNGYVPGLFGAVKVTAVASLAALWRTMRRQDVFVANPRRWVRAAVAGATSLFSSRPLRALLATHLWYAAFEDARLELAVTATDIVTGAALVLTAAARAPR